MTTRNLDPTVLSSNPRASLSAWLAFEHIVVAAFRQHPKPFAYTPTSRSAYSVASKLRDAVRGKLAFDYPCTIATADLQKWWSEVVVTNDNEKVYIGPKESKRPPVDGTVHGDFAFTFTTLTLPEIEAFEFLLSHGRIKGPVLICEPPVMPNPSPPNVERIQRPDGKLVLL